MNCPKCSKPMKVTHSYTAGATARTQRLECVHCGTVAVAQAMIVLLNPGYGQGAESLAKRLRKKSPAAFVED